VILAIDPGNIESAYCLIDEDTYKPVEFDKLENEKLINEIGMRSYMYDESVIEMVACYGMPVGVEVFDTCVWIGRFTQQISEATYFPEYICRKDEKMNLCHSMKAKDSNIVQALIDRFAPNTPNKGKGTKKEPGWFYGFKKDIWQAYAVGITYLDMRKEK
jgi:hypothetical protein